MLRWVAGGLCLLLLGGCASKQEKELMRMYEQKKLYHKTLLKTEKAVFKNDRNLTELTVVATYLNTDHLHKASLTPEDENMIASFFGMFKPKDREAEKQTPERFIMGFYSDSVDIDHLYASDINITLNSEEPEEIVPLSPSDKRLKRLSFVTDWGAFYLVSFPHAGSKMRLKVRYGDQNKTMFFTKRAKYVYTRRAFD